MGFSEELIQQVWDRARAGNDVDAATWREDECGAWMARHQYGEPDGEFGWTILNISGGGPDVLENLRAFHHGNSFDSAVGHAQCRVSADRDGQPSYGRTSQPHNKSA